MEVYNTTIKIIRNAYFLKMKKFDATRIRIKESNNIFSPHTVQLDSDRLYCSENFNTVTFLRLPSKFEIQESVELYGKEPKQVQVFTLGYGLIIRDYLY